jgi:hypothetical protein
MRRPRMVLAGVVAVVTAGAWSGVASPDRPAGGGFCSTVEDALDDLDRTSLEDIDFTDPEATQELYEQAADLYKDLGKKAPKKLRSSFKTISRFFRSLSGITDPEEGTDFPTQTRKLSKALEKVSNYLVDECGVNPSDVEGVGGE